MSSTYTRSQILDEALSLAGRSSELKASCRLWLNFFLQHIGLTFRFPELRKIGSTQQLAMGSSTASLPTDFGPGMEKSGMLFGPDSQPMSEYSYEDFAASAGFPASALTTGRPFFYFVDKNAGKFHFGKVADQAYSFTPVYFIQPPLLSIDSSADSSSVWVENDIISVMGVVWMIYKFTNDEREMAQKAEVYSLINEWKREVVKMGGTSRVQLSPNKFKNNFLGRTFGG